VSDGFFASPELVPEPDGCSAGGTNASSNCPCGRVASATLSEMERRWHRRACAPRRAVARLGWSTASIVAMGVAACTEKRGRGYGGSRGGCGVAVMQALGVEGEAHVHGVTN
jgi:hypothetical protein